MADYEIAKDFCNYTSIETMVKSRLATGWSVLYVVPVQTAYPQTYSSNANSSYIYIKADGTIDLSQSRIFLPAYTAPPEAMFELVFIKRNWNSDPCPRCAFPFPNDGDLGRPV